MFPVFDEQFIGGSNCRVVCLYQWNVIVNSFFSMCEHGSSVYSVGFIPLFLNNLNFGSLCAKNGCKLIRYRSKLSRD